MPDTVLPRIESSRRKDAPASIARRMLAEAAAAREILPLGFRVPSGADMLLAILVAEDQGYWPTVHSVIAVAGACADSGLRWLRVLAEHDLVERRGDMLALTDAGYDLVTQLAARVHAVQGSGESLRP
jgi:hypothetical protein